MVSMGYRMWGVLGAAVGLLMLSSAGCADSTDIPGDVYPTYGVRNDAHTDRCAQSNCLYRRASGEPTDPIYPAYWSSHWVMYRVFNHFQDYPPPYDGKPPAPLEEGKDYQATWGASYYDSTWVGPSGQGAMEEDYENTQKTDRISECTEPAQIEQHPYKPAVQRIPMIKTQWTSWYRPRPSWGRCRCVPPGSRCPWVGIAIPDSAGFHKCSGAEPCHCSLLNLDRSRTCRSFHFRLHTRSQA